MVLGILTGSNGFRLETIMEAINHFSTALSLFIVAVPEGLPLAISLGIAFQ